MQPFYYPVGTAPTCGSLGSLVVVVIQDLVAGVAARLSRSRLAVQNSLRALVAHWRAAGEGNQARILTAGRREHWEVRGEKVC